MGKLKLLNQFQQYYRKSDVLRKIQIALLLLLVSSNVFSANYSQTELQLSFKNVSIENIISFIEKRTEYRFLYQTSEVDLKRKVNINFKGKISKAVNILFDGTPVYPVIINKQIILKKRVKFLQDRILTGTVVDEEKIPLEGVTVLVNSYERGTSTDVNGKYKINVKPGDRVSFSYLGFKDQNFIISNQTIINVTLKEDVSLLDEVVLIGYGKEKRANVATAISSVKGKEVQNNLQTGESFDRGLDGLIKGVFVTQGTGELGGGADIIIRGVTTPSFGLRQGSNNNPLYVIDGVAIATDGKFGGTNPLQAINPSDIESMDVLKDAAATAIYGSRGANGVIIIKTKGGLYDQPTTVDLSFKTTFGTPVNTLDFLNAAEFKKHILQKGQNTYDFYQTLTGKARKDFRDQLFSLARFGFYEDPYTGDYAYDPSRVAFGNADTNWNDVVFRTAVTHLLNASVKGGGEKSFYNLSLGYLNQEGILRADEKEQYTARLNTQFDISNKFRTGVTVNYSNVLLKGGYSNSSGLQQSTTLGAGVLKFRPDLPVYDSEGKFVYDNFTTVDSFSGTKSTTLYANPLAVTTLSGQSDRSDHSVLANIFGEYDITDDLTFKAEYSYGVFFSNGKLFKPRQYLIGGFDPSASQNVDGDSIDALIINQNRVKTELTLDNSKSTNTTINYTLNYTKVLGKNTMKAMIGFSHNEEKSNTTFSTFEDFPVDIPFPQYAQTKGGTNNNLVESGLNSYFSRLSYNYDDKYGISAVVRLDRSSRFAPENRNAFFPSVAANWNIHKEDFMSDSFFRDLRLRASAGLTGSVSVGDFQYVQRFDNSGTTNYNGQPSFAFAQGFANRQLTWETTREYNVGLDFETKNRIRGGVDFYHKTTSDVISSEYEVVETSADQTPKNNAKMQNKGFEISLGADIINNENFNWSVNANASKNLNKVLAVSDVISKDDVYSNYYVVGREVNLLKGYVVNGIIQTQERVDELNAGAPQGVYDLRTTAPGDYEYKDLNGDGRIDARDVTILGSRQPDLYGGFSTNVSYKGFSLGANFSYALGLESFRFNSANNSGRFFNVERHLAAEHRWSPTNTSATLPRLIHVFGVGSSPNTRKSSVNIYDASYLRLTSLKLGYNLPSQTISKLGFSRVNVYVSGTNLVTWTSFPGLDPHGVDGGGVDAGNTDNFDAYPAAKTFSMGLNLQF